MNLLFLVCYVLVVNFFLYVYVLIDGVVQCGFVGWLVWGVLQVIVLFVDLLVDVQLMGLWLLFVRDVGVYGIDGSVLGVNWLVSEVVVDVIVEYLCYWMCDGDCSGLYYMWLGDGCVLWVVMDVWMFDQCVVFCVLWCGWWLVDCDGCVMVLDLFVVLLLWVFVVVGCFGWSVMQYYVMWQYGLVDVLIQLLKGVICFVLILCGWEVCYVFVVYILVLVVVQGYIDVIDQSSWIVWVLQCGYCFGGIVVYLVYVQGLCGVVLWEVLIGDVDVVGFLLLDGVGYVVVVIFVEEVCDDV